MFLRCVSTVLRSISSRSAISLGASPSPASRKISFSASVKSRKREGRRIEVATMRASPRGVLRSQTLVSTLLPSMETSAMKFCASLRTIQREYAVFTCSTLSLVTHRHAGVPMTKSRHHPQGACSSTQTKWPSRFSKASDSIPIIARDDAQESRLSRWCVARFPSMINQPCRLPAANCGEPHEVPQNRRLYTKQTAVEGIKACRTNLKSGS